MNRFLLAGATALLALTARDVRAQQAPPRDVFVGSRIRVRASSLRSDAYVGRIDSLDAVSMVMDTTGSRRRLGFDTGPVLVEEYRRVKLQLSSIDRLEISGGRTTKRSTIKGLIIGALGGGVLWGLGNLPEVNPSASDFVKEMPAGLVVGGVLGGVIGYSLGSEKWLPARVPR
ncbi:MAG: hypothetical protein U0132_05660 [Gemmatimonadaceae bacterium]